MSEENPFARLVGQKQPARATLAVLEPSPDRDAPVKLQLTNADLEETSYECISYDSFTDTGRATIWVGGDEREISQSLESALRTFRRKERSRTVWADLLVGNTAEERNRQAAAMKHILENANTTLCWLGPDNESTASAFGVIHDMANRWSRACLLADVPPDLGTGRMTSQQLGAVVAKVADCPFSDLDSFNFPLWKVIYSIFRAPYFQSLQCVPAIVLARKAIVVCGRSNIQWPSYIAASKALPVFQEKFFSVPLVPDVAKGIMGAQETEIAVRRRLEGHPNELFSLVYMARACGSNASKDPREYVFAMIPAATPSHRIREHGRGGQPLPTVDYSKTARDVFTEAARYTFLERQDLLLWFNERVPCARRLGDLPSWAPDFSATPPRMIARPNTRSGMEAWWRTLPCAKPIRITDDNAMHVQAYPLDRVAHVSPIFDSGNLAALCYDEFAKLPDPTTETYEQRDERFWRTLVRNTGGQQGFAGGRAAPPAELLDSFRSLMAQERICRILDCTPGQLMSSPELQARMRENTECLALKPYTGRAEAYEQQLRDATLGRRFFRTEGGRFGLTAIEDVVAADNSLLEEEKAGEEASAAPNPGRLLQDPVLRMMMQGSFQSFLQERDPRMAQLLEQSMRGHLPPPAPPPPQQQQQDSGPKGGVAKGDVVVALVGGFFPYMLRPCMGADDGEEGTSSSRPSDAALATSDSAYRFVGDCYLHGAMEGEDFRFQGPDGKLAWAADMTQIVDITLV
ncbi:hypothetical protein F4780DRAFT_187687 [Xylariomycetidae sp. FL0641]|nr:hypothetical protein F4780DRAFT_187687 [Xylariomycetidae sp. FL0641]